MSLNQVLELSFYLIIGSGLGTFMVQKFFEHRLNKKLYRFNKLYTDKLNIIRNLYRLLVQAQYALDKLLSQREPDELEGKEDFRKSTIDKMNMFINYFEENEIVIDSSIVEIIYRIKDSFTIAKHTHIFANMMEISRGSVAWEKAIDKKAELYKQLVMLEFPRLKEKLKKEFQDKYQLLEK